MHHCTFPPTQRKATRLASISRYTGTFDRLHSSEQSSGREGTRAPVMKTVAAAMLLLLALVHHASAAGHHQGHIWRHHHGGDGGGHHRSSSPLAGLRQCVTICGSGVTSCMLDCYQPLIDLDPVELPICLLKCTNDAMVCASGCPITGNDD